MIERCLDPVPARRFESPLHVRSALIKAGADEIDAGPSGVEGRNHMGETEPTARLRSSELARRLGDTLCASAKRAADGRFAGWVSDGPFAEAYPSTDLNAGGGAVVALAELVAAFDDPIHRATLRESAQWLADASRPLGAPLAGLHVGEAGAGVAQLRAGQVLGDPDLLAACAARGRWIATLPHSSPDLFGGTSGRLRFHLWLWEETCDPSHLRDAIAAGQQLLGRAEQVTGGGLRWRIPPGYDSLSNHAWLGYAHGAAGIGDALLDLFEVTSDERFLEAAQGAGQWLKELARPALEDRSGLNWPVTEDNPLTMAFWCHGATGIGRFMLHLAQLDALPSALEHAERASRVAACGARWAGATQCHGLAGNIEFLLDMYQAQGNASHLHEARSLAHLLTAFARDVNGALHWLTDSDVSNPGFAAGCSGVATCLLRLAQPETLPHALNGAGFRRPFARHKQRNLSDSEDRAT